MKRHNCKYCGKKIVCKNKGSMPRTIEKHDKYCKAKNESN